jgi:hypothetical protein
MAMVIEFYKRENVNPKRGWVPTGHHAKVTTFPGTRSAAFRVRSGVSAHPSVNWLMMWQSQCRD